MIKGYVETDFDEATHIGFPQTGHIEGFTDDEPNPMGDYVILQKINAVLLRQVNG